MSNTKKISVLTIILFVALILLFGCTTQQNSTTNGSGLMVLGTNNDNNKQSTDSNTNVYSNLDQFKKVKVGDHVAVNYVGKLKDGTIFDSSVGRSPLEFDVGAGQMIKGFDSGVVGMKVGEIKTIEIAPSEAYGEYAPQKVITVDKNQFPQFDQLQVGMQVSASNGLTGKVTSKNDTSAVIDFNHELAGKTLVFEITLVSIN
ncbi:MAG: peptidylprolyl isomerase [archaeon]